MSLPETIFRLCGVSCGNGVNNVDEAAQPDLLAVNGDMSNPAAVNLVPTYATYARLVVAPLALVQHIPAVRAVLQVPKAIVVANTVIMIDFIRPLACVQKPDNPVSLVNFPIYADFHVSVAVNPAGGIPSTPRIGATPSSH
jgi:hypothetical protein